MMIIMMESGNWENFMGRESLCGKRESFMRDHMKMASGKGLGNIRFKMGAGMRGNGLMVNNQDRAFFIRDMMRFQVIGSMGN